MCDYLLVVTADLEDMLSVGSSPRHSHHQNRLFVRSGDNQKAEWTICRGRRVGRTDDVSRTYDLWLAFGSNGLASKSTRLSREGL